MSRRKPKTNGMSSWSLVYDGFDPAKEKLREALCTLGNGNFATRGAAEWAAAGDVHYPGTYVAGCYDRLETTIAGRTIENEDLVNVPNWLPLTFRPAGGEWLDLARVELLSWRQELDLHHGVLSRIFRFRDSDGRETSVASRRLVHLYDPERAALEMTLTPENWSGVVEIRSALDGLVRNVGVPRYRELNDVHLEPVLAEAPTKGPDLLQMRTVQSRIEIAVAARTVAWRDGEAVGDLHRTVEEPGYVGRELAIHVKESRPLTIEKIVALHTSRDPAISEPGFAARRSVEGAPRFAECQRTHAVAWENLWGRMDIELEDRPVEGENHVSGNLRLHVFHLLQTASLNSIDRDVSIPARGLTGEAYRGHVFWDELFVLPFLNFRIPEITRALLGYRYRRLGEARRAAREAGLGGAMYPWQSGSDGREETQTIHLNPKSGRWLPDHSRRQRHVNSAIAYNVWHYLEVTGDAEFLSFYGAEMLLEIARFWASLAKLNPELERYEILGVVGPDEYHDAYPESDEAGLDNNAYTNVMAVWTICRALEVLDVLAEDRRLELLAKLELGEEELRRWDDVSRKMRLVFHDDGILSQFEGYERLEEFPWEAYRKKYGDIQRLDRILEAEGDTPNRYKASKQADVLMLFYLLSSDELRAIFERLGYPFEHETIPRNVDYYLQRTSHGSTLSRVVHSWVLARSDRERSWELFTEALESDVADIQGGTTPEGIHLGAMAGTVDLVQRCFTGIETHEGVLWLNPRLPGDGMRIRFSIRYRGSSLLLELASDHARVTALRCIAGLVRIGIAGEIHEIAPGDCREFPLPA